jgi:hypothetical protein
VGLVKRRGLQHAGICYLALLHVMHVLLLLLLLLLLNCHNAS